jgi:hypothetical protein
VALHPGQAAHKSLRAFPLSLFLFKPLSTVVIGASSVVNPERFTPDPKEDLYLSPDLTFQERQGRQK